MLAYKEAEELYAVGNFKAAAEAFEALGDYEDAADKAKACRYEIAADTFEAEDFAGAEILFEALGDYKDSAEMAQNCAREIGMRENADYAFLAELEAVVLNYIATFDDFANDAIYDSMEAELDILEKYENETFFVERIHELAKMYIEGTETLQSQVSASFWGDQQMRNLESFALRYGALTELYNDYDFLKDDQSFFEYVVFQNDKYQKAYSGAVAVREDLMDQLKNADLDNLMDESTGTFTLPITNNTEYTYSAVVLLHLMDVRGVPLQNSNVVGLQHLEPGESRNIVIRNVDNAEGFWEINYNTIIALVDNLYVAQTEVCRSDEWDESWTYWYADMILAE